MPYCQYFANKNKFWSASGHLFRLGTDIAQRGSVFRMRNPGDGRAGEEIPKEVDPQELHPVRPTEKLI